MQQHPLRRRIPYVSSPLFNTDLSPLFCAVQTDTPSPYTLRFLFFAPAENSCERKWCKVQKFVSPSVYAERPQSRLAFCGGQCTSAAVADLSASAIMPLSFVMSLLRPEHRYWLVLLLRFLQGILDSCLSFLCGYRTAQGWDRDVIRAGRSYAFSAQVVRGKIAFWKNEARQKN